MMMKHYKCINCNTIYWTYDSLLKHLNETASDRNDDGSVFVHTVMEVPSEE